MITRDTVPWLHAERMSTTNRVPTEVMSWTVHEEEPCEILIDVDFNLESRMNFRDARSIELKCLTHIGMV